MIFQRFFDLFFSSLALLLLSPILVGVATILRFTGEREVLFVQKRVGQYGKNFGILKFATMKKNSPFIGTKDLTLANDPRVLPVGRFLRVSKINELPQIINVLKGDMSIIGPRPQTDSSFAQFEHERLVRFLSIKPGLSGIGSIVFRDEDQVLSNLDDPERFFGEEIMPYKAQLEFWFKENYSVSLYFSLIILTVWVVVSPSTRLYWEIFSDLPSPPDSLSAHLGSQNSKSSPS